MTERTRGPQRPAAGARRRNRELAACWPLLALAALLPARAGAQDQAATSLPEKVALARLLDLCAERLDVNIAYDAANVAGEVTLRMGGGVDDEELWAMTNRILASRGFTTVEMAGEAVFTVVRLQEAFGLARIERGDVSGARAGYVRVLRSLEHKRTTDVVQALQRLLSNAWGKALDVGSGQAVLIGDLKPVVEQALWVIDQIDREDPHAIEEVRLEHRRATDLARELEQVGQAWKEIHGLDLRGQAVPSADERRLLLVVPEAEVEQWRTWIAQFDQSEPVLTRTYVPRWFDVRDVADLLEELSVDTSTAEARRGYRQVVNELTGTIIITATPAQHAEIEALFTQLEATGGSSARSVRTFQIRNRDVGEILDVLERMVEAGALDAGVVVPRGAAGESAKATADAAGQEPSRGDPERPAKETTAEGERPPALALTSDQGTNRLIAVGELRLVKELEDLLETLDVRQPQIMVEALVLGISDQEAFDLGVELRGTFEQGNTLYALSSLFGLGGPETRDAGITPGSGSGFTGVVLDPGDFAGILRALESLSHGRALTVPKVLVNNNEEATLDSVLQSPFLSTNASDTVATTSFGGTQDAGTQINVRPQLAEGDHVMLNYSVSLSTFVGPPADPSLPPPRQQNSLNSVVTLPDGYTVVLGGLEVKTEGEAVSRVPILGSLPVLGVLFRQRTTTVDRQRFFVFLRATVLRRGDYEDLKYLSDRERALAEVQDDWPVVEPRMIR